MSQYPVFLIYSSTSLSEIRDFLEEIAEEGESVGPMRVERNKGQETNRTVVLMSESIFEKLENQGFTNKNSQDFLIKRYTLRLPSNEPRSDKDSSTTRPGTDMSSRTLFIPLLPSLTGSNSREQLDLKLSDLVYFNILPQQGYQTRVTWDSRQLDRHRGSAFISFDDNVPIEAIALTRVILHGSCWDDDNGDSLGLVRCFWSTRSSRGADRKTEKTDSDPSKGETKRRILRRKDKPADQTGSQVSAAANPAPAVASVPTLVPLVKETKG